MNCRRNYPLDCTDNCPLHRNGRCNVRRRNDGGRNNGGRNNDRRNNNGGNSRRHGNAPHRNNRGRNQERRNGASRQDESWKPQTCWSFGACEGTSCPFYGTDKCQRPDLRGALKPEVSAGEDDNVGSIIKTALLNGLKKILGV